jgi:hypothetical protein
MHKTDVNGLPINSQPARSARRFGFVRGAACLAVLLALAPTAIAQQKEGTAPGQSSPAPKVDVAGDKSQPGPKVDGAASPKPAQPTPPAQPPVQAGPVPEPRDIVIVRTEVYGSMVSRVGKNATFISLVSTSSEPIPMGSKGILFRKVEKPGDIMATTWVKVAEVTLKSIDKSNKMVIVVDGEEKDVLVHGKKSNHFAKGTKIKLQIDRVQP